MDDLHQRLRATLAELHQQLQQLPRDDEESGALLRAAVEEIQAKLAQAADSPAASPSATDSPSLAEQFSEPLTEGARRFEATHPTLSRVLENLIDMLAQMGI